MIFESERNLLRPQLLTGNEINWI